MEKYAKQKHLSTLPSPTTATRQLEPNLLWGAKTEQSVDDVKQKMKIELYKLKEKFD